jgi:hypothetical protein
VLVFAIIAQSDLPHEDIVESREKEQHSDDENDQSDCEACQLQYEPDDEDGDEYANDLSGGRHSGMRRV